jgi:hypothetical protein
MIEKCIECDGTGKINGQDCPECKGKGKIKVESQLEKFIGTYRVKACLDLATNDFIRTEHGNIDPTFGDFYIPCKANCEIRDALDGELMAYIPSIGRGHNVVKDIQAKYGNATIYNIEETDGEVLFFFNIKDMEKIASIMKPMTNGASIRPFSVKNLPKPLYEIPQADIDKYLESIKNLPKNRITLHGVVREVANGLLIKQITLKFDEEIPKYKGKKYDVNAARKESGLRGKDFVHSIGLWNEYLEYLEQWQQE